MPSGYGAGPYGGTPYGSGAVSADLGASYNIVSHVHSDIAASYVITNPIHTDSVATYAIRHLATGSFTGSYNSISHATADINALYVLLPTGILDTVRFDINASYTINARIHNDIVALYSLGFFINITPFAEIIPQFQPEDLESFARRVFGELEPIDQGKDLNHYVGGMGTLFQEVEDLSRDTVYSEPGWSCIVDVNRVPQKGLDWLAQFVGIEIDHDDSDEGMRQQVRGHDRWGRGTPLSILSGAERWLPDDSKMYMSERNPTPYSVLFIFTVDLTTGQSYEGLWDLYDTYHRIRVDYSSYAMIYNDNKGDWSKVEQLLLENKPAGIQFTFLNTSTTLYVAIYILDASYQVIYDNFATYQDLYVQPFPNITIDIPEFRQLVSTKYYRNIWNQFENYSTVEDSYVLY